MKGEEVHNKKLKKCTMKTESKQTFRHLRLKMGKQTFVAFASIDVTDGIS
jgi:hypothetical protein